MIFGRRRYSSLRSMLRPLTIFITQFMLLSVGMPPRSAATSIIEGDREGALLWERYEMYVREFNKVREEGTESKIHRVIFLLFGVKIRRADV